MNRMRDYSIRTDGGARESRHRSLRDALVNFGAPGWVTTAKKFEQWLYAAGGYGRIERDGEIIAEVRP